METNVEKTLKRHTDEIKRHFDIATDEIKRHFDITQENFTSQVKLIAEQYESIIKRLNGHDEKFASIEKTITKIQVDIEIMKTDIVFIKNGLKQKVDVEEFQTLEQRVALLEAKTQI